MVHSTRHKRSGVPLLTLMSGATSMLTSTLTKGTTPTSRMNNYSTYTRSPCRTNPNPPRQVTPARQWVAAQQRNALLRTHQGAVCSSAPASHASSSPAHPVIKPQHGRCRPATHASHAGRRPAKAAVNAGVDPKQVMLCCIHPYESRAPRAGAAPNQAASPQGTKTATILQKDDVSVMLWAASKQASTSRTTAVHQPNHLHNPQTHCCPLLRCKPRNNSSSASSCKAPARACCIRALKTAAHFSSSA